MNIQFLNTSGIESWKFEEKSAAIHFFFAKASTAFPIGHNHQQDMSKDSPPAPGCFQNLP